jgi:hypothetical protein
MRHVESIAREPHGLGSAEAAKVREYVVGQLRALGLEAEIQEPRDKVASKPRSEEPGRRDVRNIVARWRGSGPPTKKALLLSAHYDSVPFGPGAGDDASGVAAILEALRALKHSPPLDRDIIILINDGEELGLFGAAVFADEHPWARDVGVVLNFDARGNSGPSYMFETSAQNGWLIEQLSQALPHPLATSLTADIYRLMPNDTDLTVYMNHKMAGLNFAFIGGLSYYHSADDTPANLDPRSLQHQGENLLAMTRRLGQRDLDAVLRPSVVYFSVLSRYMLMYPMTWVVPLSWLAALAYVLVVALGVIRGRVRLADVAAGIGLFPLAALAAVLAVGTLKLVVADLFGGLQLMRVWFRLDMPILTVFSVVALLVAGAIFAAVQSSVSCDGLGLGALAWWLAATVATSLWLTGASYAFLWPLLALLAGIAVSFLLPRGALIALLFAWLATVPLLVLHMAILPGIFNGLNLRMAAILMVPVVLTGSALLPLAAQVRASRTRAAGA